LNPEFKSRKPIVQSRNLLKKIKKIKFLKNEINK